MSWEKLYGSVMPEFWYWKYFNIHSHSIRYKSGQAVGQISNFAESFPASLPGIVREESGNFLAPDGYPDIKPVHCAVCRTDIKICINFMSDMWLKLFLCFGRVRRLQQRTSCCNYNYIKLQIFYFISNTGPESGIRIRGRLQEGCGCLTSLVLNFSVEH